MDTALITASNEHSPPEELRRLALALVLSAAAHFLAAEWLPQVVKPYEGPPFAFSLTVTLEPPNNAVPEEPSKAHVAVVVESEGNGAESSRLIASESVSGVERGRDNLPAESTDELRGQAALPASGIAREASLTGVSRKEPTTPQPVPAAHEPVAPSAGQPTELSISTLAAPSHHSAVEAEESAVPLLDYYYTSREVDLPARAIGDGLLQYPREALRLRIAGEVRLRLFIDEFGALNRSEVVSAAPLGIFEQAALEAVRSMQFEPARKGGQPVRSQRTVEITFDPDPVALRSVPSSR